MQIKLLKLVKFVKFIKVGDFDESFLNKNMTECQNWTDFNRLFSTDFNRLEKHGMPCS